MDLTGTALSNPINRAILQRLPLLGAPQACLVAGCIYQACGAFKWGQSRFNADAGPAPSLTTLCACLGEIVF